MTPIGIRISVVLMSMGALWATGCAGDVVAKDNRSRGTGGATAPPAMDPQPTARPSDSTPDPIERDAGISDEPPVSQPRDPLCDEMPFKPISRIEARIYYGTDRPSHVQLTDGQIKAIGNFYGCSGALIAPRWVLTASHCQLNRSTEFCVGDRPENQNICVGARRVINQPQGDMTLVELERELSDAAPGVEPIPILNEPLGNGWVGRRAEAAGFGADENGNNGRREFTAEPIVELYGDEIIIDGEGQRGVCFGDSGGPLMVTASDGRTRVAGVLSSGDESCVGRDRFTRVDTYRDWIEEHTGPPFSSGPPPCGEVDQMGRCDSDGQAQYCENGGLLTEQCSSGQACGWSSRENGWRCVQPADDPCRGIDYAGGCAGEVLRWCDRGTLLARDCGACDERCVQYDDRIGFVCLSNECGDLDRQGRCDGQVAEWCDGSRRQQVDCESRGQACGFVASEGRYGCVDSTGCGGLDYHGRCEGQTAEWCKDGERETLNCAETGRNCRYVSDEVGFYCTDCGDVDYQGHCEGDVTVWCNERGELQRFDCGDRDQDCAWVDNEVGTTCVE